LRPRPSETARGASGGWDPPPGGKGALGFPWRGTADGSGPLPALCPRPPPQTWFTPVGKVLDDRDAKLRGMLQGAKDNTAELTALANEAEAELKAARAEAQARIAETKAATQKECDAKLAAAKSKVDGEVNTAIAQLEAEKASVMSNMDSQVTAMSDEILKRILPEGVKA